MKKKKTRAIRAKKAPNKLNFVSSSELLDPVVVGEPGVPEPESLAPSILSAQPITKTNKTDSKSVLKFVAVGLLGVLVLVFAYYFLNLSDTSFQPGTQVDLKTFKDTFAAANNVYILMDVRHVQNSSTRQNILQCGIDFAGSSGMGGKNVTYFSIDESEGCVSSNGKGKQSDSYCFSELKNGITIYIHEGTVSSYHTNGIVVSIGPEYRLGACGIQRL